MLLHQSSEQKLGVVINFSLRETVSLLSANTAFQQLGKIKVVEK